MSLNRPPKNLSLMSHLQKNFVAEVKRDFLTCVDVAVMEFIHDKNHELSLS